MTSDLKKVLIVTYYWPPSGGGGVQRWLKFAKYLPQFGWHPVVFTPENPSVEINDPTLLKDVPPEVEVLKLPIWEPYQILEKLTSLSGKRAGARMDHMSSGRKGFVSRIATWIRGNFFIPDPRVFWVKPAVRLLSEIIRSNDIRVMVTTGPPHSMHLIGLALKKKFPDLKWVVDLRDPWSEWDLLDTLSLTAVARRRHQRLEREVLQLATRVVTIAPFHAQRFSQLGGRPVDMITNGFDEEDFAHVSHRRTNRFTIRHIGMVDSLRDPRPFLHALQSLIVKRPDKKNDVLLEFIGTVNSQLKQDILSNPVLNQVVQFTAHMPHAELLSRYGETDIQLLVLAHTVLAPGNLPGKFFEYLASGNYILGVGPVTGDAASILHQTGSGVMIDPADTKNIEATLQAKYDAWKSGSRLQQGDVSSFSRKNLASRMSDLLNEVLIK